MKRLTIILSIFILFSRSALAAEYDIKWFNITRPPETTYKDIALSYPTYSNVVIEDNGNYLSIYDINGKLLTDRWYHHIYPYDLQGNYFQALTYEFFSPYKEISADFVEFMRKNGAREHNDDESYQDITDFYRKKGFEITEGDSFSVYVEDLYDFNGKLLYEESAKGLTDKELEKAKKIEKFIIFLNDDGMYNVMDNNGKLLLDENFSEYLKASPYGYRMLENENKAFIGNSITGEYAIVDSVESLTWSYIVGQTGFVEKTHKGKYVYYNEKLKKVTDIEFDEYIGKFKGSMTFKKAGEYYVFNNEWELVYKGEKEIKAVLYDDYVIENESGYYGLYDENFNEIIPSIYEDIIPVCDNVYICSKKNTSDLYNQERLVVKDMSVFFEGTPIFSTNGYIIDENNNGMSYVYDIEGNKLVEAKAEDIRFYTNSIDIFVDSLEKEDCGRLIFKDKNPAVAINRIPLISDTVCRIKNNITLIPLRAMAEETGFNTEYIEETKEIRLTKEDKEIIFKIGDKKAVSNGVEITLNAAPEIINNRTLVPARAVSDAFGYDIDWDGERRLVEITTN